MRILRRIATLPGIPLTTRPDGRTSERPKARLEVWAMSLVDIGTGTGMLISQDSNKVLRRCQIGRVWRKAT